MSRRLVVPLLGLIALALWCARDWRTAPHATATAPTNATPTATATTTTAPVIATAAASTKDAPPSARAASTATSAKATDAVPPATTQAQTMQSVRQRLYDHWQSEPIDQLWTRDAEQLLRESARSAHVELQLVEPVSCRTDVCRAVLSVASPNALVALSQQTGNDSAVAFPMPATSSGIAVELFTAKPGSELAQRFRSRKQAPGVAPAAPAR